MNGMHYYIIIIYLIYIYYILINMGTHMHVPHVLPSYVCARTRVYHCIVHVYIYTCTAVV